MFRLSGPPQFIKMKSSVILVETCFYELNYISVLKEYKGSYGA